jgi:hypothetical protein
MNSQKSWTSIRMNLAAASVEESSTTIMIRSSLNLSMLQACSDRKEIPTGACRHYRTCRKTIQLPERAPFSERSAPQCRAAPRASIYRP